MASVLITGASSGIGREMAKQLIASGNKVWGVARSTDKLMELAGQLKTPNFFFSKCDVGVKDDWKKLKLETEQKGFKPGILILNAGTDKGDAEEIMQTNYNGVVWGCEVFLPELRDTGGIVIVSGSLFVLLNPPYSIEYTKAKQKALQHLQQRAADKLNEGVKFQYFVLGAVAKATDGSIPFWKKVFIPSPTKTAAHIIQKLGKGGLIHIFPISSNLLLWANKILPPTVMNKLLNLLKR